MLSPRAAKGHRSDKKVTAETNMTKNWSMLSPRAGKGHRVDKNDQKVVHIVTTGWKGHHGDKNVRKLVRVVTTGW